jgi:NADH-quinone oxidoreductase subunit G
MPTLEIDGQPVTVEGGLNLIQAADRIGLDIPHYCYHPGLSIAGNCRMCLVEIEKMPKLQIACNTRVAEGMVVRTRGPKVEQARRAVLEFLLINHPIDCPVCDQAGECKLQDYYMDHGRYDSRFPLEGKVRKGKVIDLGPLVVLDQERCILCTRCTRFLDEVTRTGELGVFERGDHCQIDLFPGRRLDNPYSANVVDVCPVGALTGTDFRFKARVWYLDRTETVCAACSRGCNVEVDHRRGQLYRLRPRYNPDVNRWWMCDAGRLSYRALQGDARLTEPLARAPDGFASSEWPDVIAAVVERLRAVSARHGPDAIAGIVSARATNEEAYLFTRLLREGLGTARVAGISWSPSDADQDDFLIRADKNPNTRGLELLGIDGTRDGIETIVEAAARGTVKALLLCRTDLIGWLGREQVESALEGAELVVVVDSQRSETTLYADVVLAVGTHVESDGTFTNCDGRVQQLQTAFPPPGAARPGWAVLGDLLRRLGGAAPYASAAAIFDELGGQEGPFAGLRYAALGPRGATARPESRPAVSPATAATAERSAVATSG